MPDALWMALAEPNRRAVLDVLRGGPCSVGTIAERLGMAQPAVSKHLKVLREAGLVRVTVDAQRRIYALEPRALAELDMWLEPYRALWNERLDLLGRHLDSQKQSNSTDFDGATTKRTTP